MNRNENVDDLFQVGCVGLIKAVDNFNVELDVKFSTYAVPTVIESRNNNHTLHIIMVFIVL
jgi:DNA-directed RNA polymerase specialized sigma subunit